MVLYAFWAKSAWKGDGHPAYVCRPPKAAEGDLRATTTSSSTREGSTGLGDCAPGVRESYAQQAMDTVGHRRRGEGRVVEAAAALLGLGGDGV